LRIFCAEQRILRQSSQALPKNLVKTSEIHFFYGQSSENRAGNFPEAQRKDSKKNRKNPKAMKRKDGYSEIINRNSAQQSRGFWNSFTAM
jgi:hypothetical protein